MLIKSCHLFSSPIFKFKIYIHIASCVHDDIVQSLQNKQITWKIAFGDAGTLPNVKITAWFVQNVLVLLMLIWLLVFLLHLFNCRSLFDFCGFCCLCLCVAFFVFMDLLWFFVVVIPLFVFMHLFVFAFALLHFLCYICWLSLSCCQKESFHF